MIVCDNCNLNPDRRCTYCEDDSCECPHKRLKKDELRFRLELEDCFRHELDANIVCVNCDKVFPNTFSISDLIHECIGVVEEDEGDDDLFEMKEKIPPVKLHTFSFLPDSFVKRIIFYVKLGGLFVFVSIYAAVHRIKKIIGGTNEKA